MAPIFSGTRSSFPNSELENVGVKFFGEDRIEPKKYGDAVLYWGRFLGFFAPEGEPKSRLRRLLSMRLAKFSDGSTAILAEWVPDGETLFTGSWQECAATQAKLCEERKGLLILHRAKRVRRGGVAAQRDRWVRSLIGSTVRAVPPAVEIFGHQLLEVRHVAFDLGTAIPQVGFVGMSGLHPFLHPNTSQPNFEIIT